MRYFYYTNHLGYKKRLKIVTKPDEKGMYFVECFTSFGELCYWGYRTEEWIRNLFSEYKPIEGNQWGC